jgi:transposase InsO family protein
VVEERRRFGFGAKKILRRLRDADPDAAWPARSTIDEILRRAGLVQPRRRRRTFKPPFAHRYEATAPGELTTIDFKGEFRLRNGQWCHPLTIADGVSKFLLACQALPSIALSRVWPVVERVFREHGLPSAVLSDNGPPFGAHGMGRLSTFSVRLMELGVQPVFIVPGHPEQNGSHERMHRTFGEAALRPRPATFRGAQRQMDAFRAMYNEERPHEGIAMQRPARRFQSGHCSRPFPSKIAAPDYPKEFEVRPVMSSGVIRWRGDVIFLSHALAYRRIGLEAIDDHLWDVYFGPFLIGRVDQSERRFL